MYTVKVLRKSDNIAFDEREFEYGTFAEIGYWLDHYGYIDPEYKVEIHFS